MRDPVTEYLTFSKKERLGIIVLLAVIGGIAVVPAFIPPAPLVADTAALKLFTAQVAMLEQRSNDSGINRQRNYQRTPDQAYDGYGPDDNPFGNTRSGKDKLAGPGHSGEKKVEAFQFDPNTISTADWIRLGVSERTAVTIGKYKAKGGKFRLPEDILRIFGLSESDKKRLLPLVTIAPIATTAKGYLPTRTDSVYGIRPNTNGSLFKRKALHEIDINKADTAMWSSLPGIGAILSSRIVSYRERLGGFYDLRQVAEVYGLHDTVFQKLRPFLLCKPDVRKIQLNAVTPELLQQHPYLKKRQAMAIVDFRTQHGAFKDILELKQVLAIPPDTFEKISPYLSL